MNAQPLYQRPAPTMKDILARELQIQLKNGATIDDVVDFARKVSTTRRTPQ